MKRDVGYRSLLRNGLGMTHDAHDAFSFQYPMPPDTQVQRSMERLISWDPRDGSMT